jgi:hypothetical protein
MILFFTIPNLLDIKEALPLNKFWKYHSGDNKTCAQRNVDENS